MKEVGHGTLVVCAAASLLLSCGISGVPVVDEEGQLIGVLSESDLLDKVAPARSAVDRTVELSWRRHGATTVGQACSRPGRSTAVDTQSVPRPARWPRGM